MYGIGRSISCSLIGIPCRYGALMGLSPDQNMHVMSCHVTYVNLSMLGWGVACLFP